MQHKPHPDPESAITGAASALTNLYVNYWERAYDLRDQSYVEELAHACEKARGLAQDLIDYLDRPPIRTFVVDHNEPRLGLGSGPPASRKPIFGRPF